MHKLGKGAFGSVHLARCLDSGPEGHPPSRVAIKVIPSVPGPAAANALRRELASLLALRNDRIPRVYDWNVTSGTAFVAMEHYSHGTIRDRILGEELPEEDDVWRLLEDLLVALVALHSASVLHLDVKPSNVLLDGSGGHVLADFGVSETARIGTGIVRRSKGTPGYRAPEQRNEEFSAYGARTDLWGVGATVWSFAVGTAITSAQENGPEGLELAPLRKRRPDLSNTLEWVVTSLLRAEPEERPGSAAQVLEQVREILAESGSRGAAPPAAGEPVSQAELERTLGRVLDPLTAAILEDPGLRSSLRLYPSGEALCLEGEHSYQAFLLIEGAVLVERGGEVVARVSREGELLGEVAALTGRERTASLYADGSVWACALDAPALERLVTDQPAVALRLLRSVAQR
ncbi:MAG: serine/threonine-protein kinase [Myxococcales bacterium]|nr:serine/threonine-protein kinase [Myxococcales bacterium]